MESNVLQYILTNMQVLLYTVIHSQCLDFSNDFSSQMSKRIISSHLKLGFQLFCERTEFSWMEWKTPLSISFSTFELTKENLISIESSLKEG